MDFQEIERGDGTIEVQVTTESWRVLCADASSSMNVIRS